MRRGEDGQGHRVQPRRPLPARAPHRARASVTAGMVKKKNFDCFFASSAKLNERYDNMINFYLYLNVIRLQLYILMKNIPSM